MIKYIRYLSYVLRHKWFVFMECLRMGLIWQGIIHDWSKFLPDELIPYASYFYAGDPRKNRFYSPKDGTIDFNYAWLKHQHRNPHHWQHWLLQEDDGELLMMEMPERYVKEMICDWIGAGRASGFSDTPSWYQMNKGKMVLHVKTRILVEELLNERFQ